MNAISLLMGSALLLCASAGVAAAPACQLEIADAWVRAAPPGATALAGYARVRNPCREEATLATVGADDFGMAMIHESRIENGIGKMLHVDALKIPAGATVDFAPGGRHLMLMQPRREFKEGDRTRLTIGLADGRRIAADFIVRRQAPNARR